MELYFHSPISLNGVYGEKFILLVGAIPQSTNNKLKLYPLVHYFYKTVERSLSLLSAISPITFEDCQKKIPQNSKAQRMCYSTAVTGVLNCCLAYNGTRQNTLCARKHKTLRSCIEQNRGSKPADSCVIALSHDFPLP